MILIGLFIGTFLGYALACILIVGREVETDGNK